MLGILKMFWDYRRAVIPSLLFVVFSGTVFLAHYRLKERDAAILARVVAEKQLEATQRVSAAKIHALQTTMEEADERNAFIQNTEKSIEQGRQTGDGPLAPVLRDTLDRLRKRQAGH